MGEFLLKANAAPTNTVHMSTILLNSPVQKMGLLKTYLEITPADKVEIIRTMRIMPKTNPIESKIEAIFFIRNRLTALFIELTPLYLSLLFCFPYFFFALPGNSSHLQIVFTTSK